MLLGNAVDSLVTYEKLQHPGPTLKKKLDTGSSQFSLQGIPPIGTLFCHFMHMGIGILLDI